MLDILKGLRYFLCSDPSDFKYAGVGAVICDDDQKKILAEESLIYECAKCGYRYDKHVEHFEGRTLVKQTAEDDKKNNKEAANQTAQEDVDKLPNSNGITSGSVSEDRVAKNTHKIQQVEQEVQEESGARLIGRVAAEFEEKGVNTDDVFIVHENLYQFNFTNEILEELSVFKSIIGNVTYEKHIKIETSKTFTRSWLTTLNVLEALGSLIVLVIVLKYAVGVIRNQFETLISFN